MISAGLITICGPTATGKSSLGLVLAEAFDLPILSADSRQVYQGFDLGTAKPTAAEQARVPHWLMDCCPPTETFTVADFQQQARSLISEFHAQAISPLLVGGTGLYLQSIVEGLKIPRVPPHAHLRSQLEQISQAERHQWLGQVDHAASTKIHPNDQVRTLRALEVYYVTGQPLSALQGKCPPSYPILQLGVDIADPEQQLTRITQRTHHMLAQGWLKEVQALMNRYGAGLPLLNTLGYGELKQYLLGQCSKEEAIQAIIMHTRQFAKRQRTWFRAQPNIHWLDSTKPTHQQTALELVADFLRSLNTRD